MKIKTYAARDMRSALRQVRDEQGPDAVILGTRHLAGGVEVSIAIDPSRPCWSRLRRLPPRPLRISPR